MFQQGRFVSRSIFALVVVVSSLVVVSAQVKLPRSSPGASVKQTIGITDVVITYSRPGVKGRTIWGDPPKDSYAEGEATLDNSFRRPEGMAIVPYGHLWRTGANEATQFTVSDPVLINGQPLAAGTYSLHTIPGKTEWTIVFNDQENQWGSFNYDASKDTLRVKATPATVAENQEWLDFAIEPTADNKGVVTIAWEKVRVPFTVEVKDQNALIITKAREAVAAAKGDDWQTPNSAAGWAKANGFADDAKMFYEKAIAAIDAQLKQKETFQNLQRKSGILRNAGKMAESLAVAEKAVTVGKAEGADTSALEKQIADAKKAMK